MYILVKDIGADLT